MDGVVGVECRAPKAGGLFKVFEVRCEGLIVRLGRDSVGF